ncbi:MAG TPA: DNA methylase N-4, partial [Aquificaceae bacterium]|nr:DNA methylase N-4 [Aquificaceae bacterium]
ETIETNTGLNIKFLGVKVIDRERTLKYLKDYILGKEIFIRNYQVLDEHTVKAYVYLKNKIFVNAYLLKSGLALPDLSENHLYKKKFIKLWQEVSSGERVDT